MKNQKIILCTNGVLELATENDIMCGRGKTYQKNPGNVKFLYLIRSNVQRYIDARTQTDRSSIVAKILEEINESGARFIKKDPHTKEWYIMSRDMAHDKIGHSIRDMIARQRKMNKSKSSVDNTLKTKQQQRQEQHICLEPICHRSASFHNHDITRAFSVNSGKLLGSLLKLNDHFETDTVNAKNSDGTKHGFISTEYQRQRLSICTEKMFRDLIDVDNDLNYDITPQEIFGC